MQAGDYSRPLAVSRHAGVRVRHPQWKEAAIWFCPPETSAHAGSEALSVHLPRLVVSRLSSRSWSAHRAHAAR